MFVKEKLLFWVEVMGLMGKEKEPILLVRMAENWVIMRRIHENARTACMAPTGGFALASLKECVL
ncbi:hypothetical protein FRB95_008705, partial [Tulasnella sp. JGI-2019a]